MHHHSVDRYREEGGKEGGRASDKVYLLAKQRAAVTPMKPKKGAEVGQVS